LNVLFLTQGRTLDVFSAVATNLRKSGNLDKAAFYISDKEYYRENSSSALNKFLDQTYLIKEWEIYEEAIVRKPNREHLMELENEFGDPTLWNAIVSDRRLFLGAKAAFTQDYNCRYTHDQLLSVLELTMTELLKVFDSVQPVLVVNFICVTIGEYLAYLVARNRGIRMVNLRPSRIANFFVEADHVNEPSGSVLNAYSRLRSREIDEPEQLRHLANAREYLSVVRDTHSMYEGVTTPLVDKSKRRRFHVPQRAIGVASTIGRLIQRDLKRSSEKTKDNYYRPGLYSFWISRVVKPARERYLENLAIPIERLRSEDYAFYPLHKEPEVTLLVYGRYALNQIEVIRNIALSLPVGFKLVVKEHPASIGYRPRSYYKKLLAIPNVVLISSFTKSRVVVQNSRLVAVVSGSIGFEALVCGKPLIVIGNAPFQILPRTMIRTVNAYQKLAQEIKDLLSSYVFDEDALEKYVASVMESGVPVNFYTDLLKREEGYKESEDELANTFNDQVDLLSRFIVGKARESQEVSSKI